MKTPKESTPLQAEPHNPTAPERYLAMQAANLAAMQAARTNTPNEPMLTQQLREIIELAKKEGITQIDIKSDKFSCSFSLPQKEDRPKITKEDIEQAKAFTKPTPSEDTATELLFWSSQD